MAKLKTIKTVSKRFKVTAKGKLLARRGGQDHFNSRESGKVTRNKRRNRQVAKVDRSALRATMPNAKF